MPNNELPHRAPFVGPPRPEVRGWWRQPSAEMVAQLGDALSGFEFPTTPEESSRGRGVESSGSGRTNGEA